MLIKVVILLLDIMLFGYAFHIRQERSIDLSASHPLIADARLSKDILPRAYDLTILINTIDSSFKGNIKMNLSWIEATKKISLHAHYDLNINKQTITLKKFVTSQKDADFDHVENIEILRADRMPKKTVYVIYLKNMMEQGSECELSIDFDGYIWENTVGLFKGSYTQNNTEKSSYIATYMRPNNARRLFPCFDEPGFKVPFNVHISRHKDYITVFNTPLIKSEKITDGNNEYIMDHFETTPPISTFAFGFITCKLEKYSFRYTSDTKLIMNVNIWVNPDIKDKVEDVILKFEKVYRYLEAYFNVPLPLKKIDIVGIPNVAMVRPSDNWGLLMFKENDLLKKGYYTLTQELIYHWIGNWVTPYWWSDAHINKALVSFLCAETVLQIDDGVEFNGKYPMTILYSSYYEFSKRYPHSRITGMKQETTSYKTELVMRMLNHTLTHEVFKRGVRKFISDHHFGTFFGDDFFDTLTKEAHIAEKLSKEYSIAEIAGSWITKDRLPVISVERNYLQNSAKVTQKVYLRERPHDVPEQDKMLWWIPLVMIDQSSINFQNSTPYMWMKKSHEEHIHDLPNEHNFIIVNPEEIGPFPVNYDEHNWNLLSTFLQADDQRKLIPTYTRAKLLHDAWNLAYAGDLSFGIAFNMTLFMKYERNHIVWNPVFTFIDHIGRHIDISGVHRKFESYVRALLTPLYEELGEWSKNEESWKTDLRSLAKTFLCRVGYVPCIEQAQSAFILWMEMPNPDEKTPVENQYICPVFKWATIKEWEFGLQRVIHFPKSRIQSERTYLLKTLAGCPNQPEKINRLLNLTLLENNTNFTENDILLIFNMLTGRSTGYMTLFKFLSDNWTPLRERFQNNTNVWDSLIGSATGVFTTNEGYDMVNKFYQEHNGSFGSAEHIIEKSLRHIKEEAKWSSENLPVIESWLNNFLGYPGKRIERESIQTPSGDLICTPSITTLIELNTMKHLLPCSK